jgi:hypothetical protein
MTEIAEQISNAIGRSVRYINVTPAQRNQALLAAGLPAYVVEAFDVQACERRKGATREAVIHLETHVAFGIRPTTFAEFARANAVEIGKSCQVGVTGLKQPTFSLAAGVTARSLSEASIQR